MGRLLLLILIIVAVVLLWKAFGPKSWQKNQPNRPTPPREIKGPDDDEDFLWNLEKDRFKQRRAREEAAREEAERMKRARDRYQAPPEAAGGGATGIPEGPRNATGEQKSEGGGNPKEGPEKPGSTAGGAAES